MKNTNKQFSKTPLDQRYPATYHAHFRCRCFRYILSLFGSGRVSIVDSISGSFPLKCARIPILQRETRLCGDSAKTKDMQLIFNRFITGGYTVLCTFSYNILLYIILLSHQPTLTRCSHCDLKSMKT